MPLWGNKDNAANSDIAATMYVKKSVTRANQTSLYDNTTPDAFIANATIGQFAVDVNEAQANPQIPHAGWVLKKTGSGGRAGRTTYEVLVAGGSYGLPDTDAGKIGNYKLTIKTQPKSTSANISATGVATLQVGAVSAPAGATITYQWQRNGVNLNNGAGVANILVSGATTNTLTITANAQSQINGNSFGVLVNTANASANLVSTNAVVTIIT